MKPAVLVVVFMVVFGHQVSSHHRQNELGEAVREFAQKLQEKLTRNKQGSIILSPLSSHSSLSMASLGAGNETVQEMERTLNYDSPSLSPAEAHDEYSEILAELQSPQNKNVDVAIAMFVNSDKSIKQSFKSQAQSKYLAKIDSFNPSNPEPEKKINEYVSEETNGEIKEIIPKGSINEDTSVLLVSTLSFNASWEEQFDESKTSKQEFTREDGSKSEVDMMNDTRTVSLKRDSASDVSMIRIPYKGGRYQLYIALPQSAGGLADLESRLSQPSKTSQLLKNLKPARVELGIPKFTIESRFDLKECLREMGVQKAFSSSEADFSGISQSENLLISQVIHSAQIEVNERGTTTSSSSAIEIQNQSNRQSQQQEADEKFIANHSFLYWIMDSTSKQTLFQGRFTGKQQ